jgi:hypothetical protein
MAHLITTDYINRRCACLMRIMAYSLLTAGAGCMIVKFAVTYLVERYLASMQQKLSRQLCFRRQVVPHSQNLGTG